jgi:hypothetical protein
MPSREELGEVGETVEIMTLSINSVLKMLAVINTDTSSLQQGRSDLITATSLGGGDIKDQLLSSPFRQLVSELLIRIQRKTGT